MHLHRPWWHYWLKAVMLAIIVFCAIMLIAFYSQWKADQDNRFECMKTARDYAAAQVCP